MSEKFQNLSDLDRAIRWLTNLSSAESKRDVRLSEESSGLDEKILRLAELLATRYAPEGQIQYIRLLEERLFVKLLRLRDHVMEMIRRLLINDPACEAIDHLYDLIQCFRTVVQERVEAVREEKPVIGT